MFLVATLNTLEHFDIMINKFHKTKNISREKGYRRFLPRLNYGNFIYEKAIIHLFN